VKPKRAGYSVCQRTVLAFSGGWCGCRGCGCPQTTHSNELFLFSIRRFEDPYWLARAASFPIVRTNVSRPAPLPRYDWTKADITNHEWEWYETKTHHSAEYNSIPYPSIRSLFCAHYHTHHNLAFIELQHISRWQKTRSGRIGRETAATPRPKTQRRRQTTKTPSTLKSQTQPSMVT